MADDSVRVVCGPTAAGKSALALALAERRGLTIVSADSRQIYRGFDIGTAKPSPAERRRVPHRGIDVVPPDVRYSAAAWAEAAHGWIAEAAAAGRPPLVVGGTGFYLRALFAPLFEEPPLDAPRREALARELAALDVASLRRWCERLDPARAHLGRTQLLRAIEVALLTGRPLSEWHRATARPSRLAARYLVVDPGAVLRDRIAARLEAMLAAGWLDEVRRLSGTVPASAPAWNATGYGAVRDVASGRTTLPEARERILVETRQYAKRQRTWFRHQLAGADVTHLDPDDPDAATLVERWWAGEHLV
ncbi:MAG TPA: tRNA (adenosine(37)-N6)-dimethylallyltransferase MiaA [Gemmatimonadaceae bacterium]